MQIETLKLLRLSLQLRSSVKQTITSIQIHARIGEGEKERGKEGQREREKEKWMKFLSMSIDKFEQLHSHIQLLNLVTTISSSLSLSVVLFTLPVLIHSIL